MSLTVTEVVDLGPNLRQIRLGGEDMIGFRFAPGQDLMLRLPLADGSRLEPHWRARSTNDAGI